MHRVLFSTDSHIQFAYAFNLNPLREFSAFTARWTAEAVDSPLLFVRHV